MPNLIERLRAAAPVAARYAGSRYRPALDPLAADLIAALTAGQVRTDGAERALLSHDASVFDGGVAGPVVFPTSTQDVQAVMRVATKHGRSIVPRGRRGRR